MNQQQNRDFEPPYREECTAVHLYSTLLRVTAEQMYLCVGYEMVEKQCRCINPPNDTPFVKNGIYEWSYIIDGYEAVHESGITWGGGEIAFLKHFQIISGKWSDINSDKAKEIGTCFLFCKMNRLAGILSRMQSSRMFLTIINIVIAMNM